MKLSLMENIISINQQRFFTVQQANELLPLIHRITEASYLEVKSLMNRVQSVKSSNPTLASDIEKKIDENVEKWQKKVERLGATPKGLWLADFDNGSGYYCWKFPETTIQFHHGYSEGFSGRKEI